MDLYDYYFFGLIFAVVINSSMVSCISQSCEVTASDGSRYDLSDLKKVSVPWTFGQFEVSQYSFSVCDDRIDDDCGEFCGGSAGGYCERQPIGLFYPSYCIGNFLSITALDKGMGVELLYANGDEGRGGVVKIECDKTGIPGSLIVMSAYSPPSNLQGYKVTAKSASACAGSSGGDDGMTLGEANSLDVTHIHFSGGLGIVVYLIGGALYNYQVRQYSGWELIPHREWWLSLPGLALDGIRFTRMKIREKMDRY